MRIETDRVAQEPPFTRSLSVLEAAHQLPSQ